MFLKEFAKARKESARPEHEKVNEKLERHGEEGHRFKLLSRDRSEHAYRLSIKLDGSVEGQPEVDVAAGERRALERVEAVAEPLNDDAKSGDDVEEEPTDCPAGGR